ncbi:MAG: hypothetical protein QXG48_03980 [Thermofilaceae archaeon]
MGADGKFTLAAIVIATALTLQLAVACFSPADIYAVEVVLNKPGVEYDLSKLTGAREIEYANGVGYAYRSHSDPRLIVVLSEQRVNDDAKHLAVRVQAPVAWREYKTLTCSIPPPCHSNLRESISLPVSPREGEAEVALGTLTLNSSCYLRFKPVLSAQTEGNASLIVSGSLLLKEVVEGIEYRISMPCLLSVGEGCARILALIPGYDAPMLVKPGAYEVTLTLSWSTSTQTTLTVLRLNIECSCTPWAPLPRELGWELEEGVLTKRIGGATLRVSSSGGFCQIVIEGAADLSEVKGELEKLFEAISLGAELIRKCELVETVDSRLTLAEQVSEDDVKAALKAELEWLVENRVVSGLEPADTALIAAAAKLGYAGWNQRLVWYEGGWIPYSQVPGATLVRCVTGVHPEFVAGSNEYVGLSQASATKTGETFQNLAILALASIAALAAAAITYVVIKKKLPA